MATRCKSVTYYGSHDGILNSDLKYMFSKKYNCTKMYKFLLLPRKRSMIKKCYLPGDGSGGIPPTVVQLKYLTWSVIEVCYLECNFHL